MSIQIKLTNGKTITFGQHNKDIQRSQVDRKDLSIFDKYDKNGDEKLTVEEMKIGNDNLQQSRVLNSKLENGVFSGILSKEEKNKEIKDLISKIEAKDIHAVLAGFQVTANHSNETLNEWNSRNHVRRAGYTPLTLTQAIVNYKRIDDKTKKDCLKLILNKVVQASRENTRLTTQEKNRYIKDLSKHIDNMTFNGNTNADLINALLYVLMPNNGIPQDYENIMKENGYDVVY